MAPIFTGNWFGFGRGGGPSVIEYTYFPSSNPANIISSPSNVGLEISAVGQYTLNVNAPGSVPFIMWGSGGTQGDDPVGTSGAGGCAEGNFALLSGTNYIIIVGSTGTLNTASPFGGGGNGGSPAHAGGAGGGYTGLFVSSISQVNARLIAGGGGGSHGVDAGSFSATGGGGGGTSGSGGTPTGGGGGSQDSGGSAGTGPGQNGTAGTALQGGTGGTRSTNQGSGGGGGGGYFGGGGGAAGGFGGGQAGSPGGGGSGYLHPTIGSGTLYEASPRTVAGNSTSPLRGTAGNSNTPGKFIIRPL